MPNSTCSRASDRASAAIGADVIQTAAPPVTMSETILRVRGCDIRRIEATISHAASDVPRVLPRKAGEIPHAPLRDVCEMWSDVSTNVEHADAIIDVGRAEIGRASC